MKSFYLLIALFFLSCSEKTEEKTENQNNVISENGHFTESWDVITSNLKKNQDHLLIQVQVLSLISEIDSIKPIVNIANAIEFKSESILEALDAHLEILDQNQIPHESNFENMDKSIRAFNDIISENDTLWNNEMNLSGITENNYELFMSSPLQYTYQKKVEVLTSSNELLIDLMQTINGIKGVAENSP